MDKNTEYMKKAKLLDELIEAIPKMARYESADGMELVMVADVMTFISKGLVEDSQKGVAYDRGFKDGRFKVDDCNRLD